MNEHKVCEERCKAAKAANSPTKVCEEGFCMFQDTIDRLTAPSPLLRFLRPKGEQ